MIRYNLKEGPREEYQGVKKAFLELYKFDREDPGRIKLEGNDALVYDHPENSSTYLFEITDKKTGHKSIELFDRRVSAQDRVQKKAEEATKKSGNEATPEQGKGNEPAPK